MYENFAIFIRIEHSRIESNLCSVWRIAIKMFYRSLSEKLAQNSADWACMGDFTYVRNCRTLIPSRCADSLIPSHVHENFEKFKEMILTEESPMGSWIRSLAGGAIESNCPSGSKSSRIFQNFQRETGTMSTVHTFDGDRVIPAFLYNPSLKNDDLWTFTVTKST